MPLNIPNYTGGAEALQRGVEQGTGLWQQMMGHGINLGKMHQQGQQFNQTLGFNEKQLAQQHMHHQDTIGIQMKQLEQAAALLPYQIQHLIDQHQITPYQAQNLYAQGMSHLAQAKKDMMFANLLDPNGGQMSMPGQQSNIMSPPVQPQGIMNPPMQAQNMQMPMGQRSAPMQQAPMGMAPQGQPHQQRSNVPYPQQAQPPAQPAQQTVTPEQIKQEVAQSSGFIDPADLKPGETVTIRPAQPGKERLDNVAGLMGIPGVTPTVVDGVQYERWPSGKLTATRTGASPEQKAELETKKKEQQETNKRHVIERQKLEEELPKAKKDYELIEQLEKLYEKNKGHEKEWWGNVVPGKLGEIQGGLRKYYAKGEDYGRIQDITGKLVGKQSNEYSSRGLQTGLQMAEKNKPGFNEDYSIAKGKVLQLKESAKKGLDIAEKRLKDLQSGKAGKSEGNEPEETKTINGKTYYKYADGWHDEMIK